MVTTGNEYGIDGNGDDVLLSSRGQQVMMQWEKEYMETCVEALAIRSTDHVLEIGFGLAYSATHIQQYHPASHTIIECDAAVLERATSFALRHQSETRQIAIVEGTWQSMLPTLGRFDCVFFDDYPLPELEKAASPTGSSSRRSRWHDFLDVVLHHVYPGGRITGYLARQIDLKREGCSVETKGMAVQASPSCNYYPHQEAYVPVITVNDPQLAAKSRRHLIRERIEHVRENLAEQSIGELHDLDRLELRHEIEERFSSVGIVVPLAVTHRESDVSEPVAYQGHESRAAFLASLRGRARLNQSSARE